MSPLDHDQVLAVLNEQFAGEVVDVDTSNPDPIVIVQPGRVLELMTFCRDDSRLQFDLLSCVTGIDYPERGDGEIECVWCLDSTSQNHWLIVKAILPRSAPKVPSVVEVWKTADWHERETFDLVGIEFEGHPNLIRILCAEDWIGHPLRKDYVIPDTYHGIKNVIY